MIRHDVKPAWFKLNKREYYIGSFTRWPQRGVNAAGLLIALAMMRFDYLKKLLIPPDQPERLVMLIVAVLAVACLIYLSFSLQRVYLTSEALVYRQNRGIMVILWSQVSNVQQAPWINPYGVNITLAGHKPQTFQLAEVSNPKLLVSLLKDLREETPFQTEELDQQRRKLT